MTADIKELTALLRKNGERNALEREAADAIESLQRENAELRHDIERCLNSASGEATYAEQLQRENAALRKVASRTVLQAIDAGIAEGIAHSKAEVERLQRELEEARKDAATICEEIALRWQQEEGAYAAGKKAGALECAKAIAARQQKDKT